jgi:iron complex outermembrane receptor protein
MSRSGNPGSEALQVERPEGMAMLKKVLLATTLALLVPVTGAFAQHADDNPVVSADDAFGLTLGLESTGIYNPFSIRGFNPQAAGNARIDGLYFDQQGNLSNRVVEGSTVRVGISEIGYAFPAPTGIADYDLRHATGDDATASIIAESGPFDLRNISVDGSLPLVSSQLQLPVGVSYTTGAGINTANFGYGSRVANIGAVPKWTPNDRITVRFIADWQKITQAQTMPIIFTAGNFLPPRIGRGYLGQNWAESQYLSENFGATLKAKLTQHWSLAAGVFRSISDSPVSYADLYFNTEPNGTAEHFMVGSPDQNSASTSGEVRLTGDYSFGKWYHEIVVMARGRDEMAHYGGSDAMDVGMGNIGLDTQVPEPDFVYTARTADHTELWSTGVAYQVRPDGLGQLAVGVQKEEYEKTVDTPGEGQSHLTDSPWRLYSTAAVPVGHASLYAGYTQGLEDSGIAPSTAENRNTILPATRTWQVDGGVRLPLSSKLNLIAGLFELNKPYFNLDTDNVDRQLGQQRATGLELSIAGQLAPTLNVNAGALIGEVHVIGPDLAAEGVGSAAFGQPRNQYLINVDYGLPKWPALSTDLSVYHFGLVPAAVNDAFYDSAVTVLNLGARYRFNILGAPATLRVQLQNVTNVYFWNVQFSPGFLQFAPRTFLAYLTVDLKKKAAS